MEVTGLTPTLKTCSGSWSHAPTSAGSEGLGAPSADTARKRNWANMRDV